MVGSIIVKCVAGMLVGIDLTNVPLWIWKCGVVIFTYYYYLHDIQQDRIQKIYTYILCTFYTHIPMNIVK